MFREGSIRPGTYSHRIKYIDVLMENKWWVNAFVDPLRHQSHSQYIALISSKQK